MYNSSDLDRQHQPSSLLAEFRPSSPEAEAILERFISNTASPDHEPHHPHQMTLEEEEAAVEDKNWFQNRMLYQPPPAVVPGNNRFQGTENSVVPTGDSVQSKANLIRHSSSPAGLFSNLIDGYGVLRGMGNFKRSTGFGGEGPILSGSRLKSQSLSQISEMESEGEGLGMSRSCNNGFLPSWDDTAVLPNNFSGMKRGREMDGKLISPQNSFDILSENMSSHQGLRHQFSLPKTSSEMAAMEKFLRLNDSVPCKIRAKRGCATHPRSIAERVRRTKISERMRKLQELVPNMDKQTNTADMLDLAVDYIKDLQKQVKTLSDGRASCTCSSKLLHCD